MTTTAIDRCSTARTALLSASPRLARIGGSCGERDMGHTGAPCSRSLSNGWWYPSDATPPSGQPSTHPSTRAGVVGDACFPARRIDGARDTITHSDRCPLETVDRPRRTRLIKACELGPASPIDDFCLSEWYRWPAEALPTRIRWQICHCIHSRREGSDYAVMKAFFIGGTCNRYKIEPVKASVLRVEACELFTSQSGPASPS